MQEAERLQHDGVAELGGGGARRVDGGRPAGSPERYAGRREELARLEVPVALDGGRRAPGSGMPDGVSLVLVDEVPERVDDALDVAVDRDAARPQARAGGQSQNMACASRVHPLASAARAMPCATSVSRTLNSSFIWL